MFASLFRRLGRLWRTAPIPTAFAALTLAYCTWVFVWGGAHVLWPAWRLSHLPPMDAADVLAASTGEAVLTSGRLDGNLPAAHGFVLYASERWEVTTDSDGHDTGQWVDAEGYFPDLRLSVEGQTVLIQGNPDVILLGDVRLETYSKGSSLPMGIVHPPEGALRYRGLRDGELVTVLGRKSDSDSIKPSRLFLGDLETARTWQWESCRNFLLAALLLLIVAPPLAYLLTWLTTRRSRRQ